MRALSNFVSLHPYFKVHPGKLDAVKAMLPRLVEKSSAEKACLFYEFTLNRNELFCREAYENADGLLAHIENVGQLLAEVRANRTPRAGGGVGEVKEAAGAFNPAFFALEATQHGKN